jgi:hypothetical protein
VRDWTAIRAWASDLAVILRQPLPSDHTTPDRRRS